MEDTTLASFLCFKSPERREKSPSCTSTYCVLVHFYLFTEGYFQYTVVQLYFVEIWYIEHIEEWGKCWKKKKKSFQVEEMKKEEMLVAQIMITTSLLSFFFR